MNICIFGDSIAWGAFDYINGGWVNLFKKYYLKEGTETYNLGVSGDNTTSLLKRLEGEALSRNADIIIFAIGINDSYYIFSKKEYRVPFDTFKNNLDELLNISKKMTNRIIFIGITNVDEKRVFPIPWDNDKAYSNKWIKKYDQYIEEFCKKQNLQYIDMRDIFKEGDLEDGLHPNEKGHEKMFEKIKKEINL